LNKIFSLFLKCINRLPTDEIGSIYLEIAKLFKRQAREPSRVTHLCNVCMTVKCVGDSFLLLVDKLTLLIRKCLAMINLTLSVLHIS